MSQSGNIKKGELYEWRDSLDSIASLVFVTRVSFNYVHFFEYVVNGTVARSPLQRHVDVGCALVLVRDGNWRKISG